MHQPTSNEARVKTRPGSQADRAAVASNMDRIADAVSSAPEIDLRKIEALRRELSRGTYEVDPDRIAMKFLHLNAALHKSGRRRVR